MKMFPLNAVDFYKTGHYSQYPEGTELVYSNLTCRSDKWAKVLPDFDGRAVFFGLQGVCQWLLIDLWDREFFMKEKDVVVDRYRRRMDSSLGPGAVSVDHIEALHDLGYLPLLIKAVPEGSRIPMRVPMLTIQNTHPDFYWLTNYIETQLSAELWKAITSATTAYEYKRLLTDYAKMTGSPEAFVPWQGHDFSARGMSGIYDAAASGGGHLLSFFGTDTVAAIDYLEDYYGATGLVGGSVPATEHSVMCLGGEDDEIGTFRRLITNLYPSGIISIVSDSWDFWRVMTEYTVTLKSEIMSRTSDALGNAKVVFRPDCYDAETEILTENGWVKFPNLDIGIKVAQMHDDWTVDFVEPLRYVDQEYIGDMIRITSYRDRIDLLVTPNHRLIINDLKGNLMAKEAADAKFYDNRSIPRIAPARDNGERMTPYEKFLVAFQADGSYPSGFENIESPGSLCGHISVRFNFQKIRKTERLIGLCQEAGLDYDVHREPARGELLDQDTIYVRVPVGAPLSKNFDWVAPLSRDFTWCCEFINELGHWDGSFRKDGPGRLKYDTTIPYNAEIAQLVAIRGGWGCHYGIHTDDRSEAFSDIHALSITTKQSVGGQSICKERVAFSGRVYCVQVPTGRLVVRRNRKIAVCGNSGDPVKIICGDFDASVGSPESKGAIECLWDVFGGTATSEGFKLLDSHVGVIYGDSITLDRAQAILAGLKAKGFASANIVFGVGSWTYQGVTRDSFGTAIKATFGRVNGEDRVLFKAPKTDNGIKNSARGLLRVETDEENGFVLHEMQTWEQESQGCLETVFKDGELVRFETLDVIRKRLAAE